MLKALKDWTRWIAGWIFIGMVVTWVLNALPIGRDDTDGAWPHRSGVNVATDAATGCQYLLTRDGGITPRVDAKSKQLGCRP
jgi:hypothetical protein